MKEKYYHKGLEITPREYWVEEMAILEYTEEIRDLVSPEKYQLVFDMFKNASSVKSIKSYPPPP